MKAKSARLRNRHSNGRSNARPQTGSNVRLPHAERKAQILQTASRFFAEYGLTAQTRRLAEECGVSQRLLYRFFPTKEDLLAEVYRAEILGQFKAVWFVELQDRTKPIDQRLRVFYKDYLETVLTRNWLRLFMYASLADASMAPDYIAGIITQLLEVIVRETAVETGVALDDADDVELHEIGWALHGSLSHFAIRRHLYHASTDMPVDRVVAMHVCMFVTSFEAFVSEFKTH